MAEVGRDYSTKDERIVLGLLESVERDGAQSQRKLASELGIALGLVNAYLKRCVKKGLLKVSEAPARRYAYYLTPQGFAEKSKLTVDYLSYSFLFFRQARADCTSIPDCLPRYYVQVRLQWPDPPCFCPELVVQYRDPELDHAVGIDLITDRPISMDLRQAYLDQVAQGLLAFDRAMQAAAAGDRGAAARFRQSGQAAFLTAARLLGGLSVRLSSVGDVDLLKFTAGPRVIDWLSAAGEHLATGLTVLGRAAATGDPHPWGQAGAEFDAASQLLIQGGAR